MSRFPPPVPLRACAFSSPDRASMRGAYPVGSRRGTGIVLAAAAHLLLGWGLLTNPPSTRGKPAPTAHSGPEIQWLLPRQAPPVRMPAATPAPALTLARRAPPPAPPRRSQPVAAAPAEALSAPAAAAPPVPVPAQEDAPAAPARPLDAAQLVRDLKLTGMASGLDGKGKASGAAAMSLEAKLAAGIERAHAGDKSWLTSNGFEEISSTENIGTRVYRMRSVLGTFCVYVTDGKPPVTGKCR